MSKSITPRSVLLVLAAAIILTTTATAADTRMDNTGGDRVRIGLVLGGGGARGAAHIGVLKELERLRVPVDAIAGTSMGAFIGGLYASGMSADELEQVVVSLDWVSILSDTPRRRDLSFRRKQDDEQYPVDLELGIRAGELLLPKGFVQGHNLDLVLRELTDDVGHISNFDELPIPFRAVASDIARGEAHVMASGDLALAIRASMSVPGLIAPARVDEKFLVDGGLVANLPIDVMRKMDVDVIIAVNTEFPLYTPEALQSGLRITEQMLTILIRKETLRQIDTLESGDILIRPKLGIFASANFAAIAKAIEPGVESIGDVEDRLRTLAMDEQVYADHLSSRKSDTRHSEHLAFVRIVHDGRLAPELLLSRLGVFSGEPIEPRRLADGANRLYGLNLYEQVSYRLVEEGGATGVEYEAVSKSWDSDFLNVGVSVQDDFDGSTAFNLSARLTMAGLNRRGAEWRTDFQLGTDMLLLSEFYQPFGHGLKYFVAPRIDLRQTNQNVFVADDSTARLRVSEAQAGIDIGVEIGTFGELRFGAYRGKGESRIKVGDPQLSNVKFDSGGVFAGLSLDTLDDPRFPRAGIRADLKWDLSRPAFGADQSFDTFEADFLSVWSRGKSSLQLGLSYATTSGSAVSIQDYFPLGGFLRLSGFEPGRISGPHAGMTRLVYYRLVSDSTGGLFEVPMYLGASAEAGNAWQTRSDMSFDSLIVNGSLFAAFDTYFGAIYIAAGFAEGGERSYYLSIGSPPR